MNELYKKIDIVIEKIDKYRKVNIFDQEVKKRSERKPPKNLTSSELLKIFVELISYSQQAKSKNVKQIIESKVFNQIFDDYNLESVAKMNPCDLVDKYWVNVSGIRQQTKFFQIVMFSRVLQKNKKIIDLLSNPPIPKSIKNQDDISAFWIGFKELKQNLKDSKTPFIRETTTLLHLLLETGYDCIKPDSAVMKASKKLGLVESESGDTNFIETVKFIQEYSLYKKIRPSAIDLYLLIEGKQTDAKQLVEENYYE